MPKLRRLSGRQVVAIMEGFGFEQISQKGSHAKLRKIAPDGEKQTLVVPLDPELPPGTRKAIYRQACRYVSSDELHRHFYAD